MSNQQQMEDPPVPLRVHESSPSDPQYPATNVLEGNPLSPGWRTMPDILFPLFLTLELDGLYELSSVQFVSHEAYVPQEVELFTSVQMPAVEWVRLGTVRMGTAAAHNARERKTFKFKVKARVLKFQFPDYLNMQVNTHCQISLTSVVVRGKLIPGVEMQQYDANSQVNASQNQVNKSHLNDQMIKKAQEVAPFLQLVDSQKEQLDLLIQECVDKDEYLMADRYLVTIQKLEGLKDALEQLQIKKLSAIGKQEFKAANQIKMSQQQIQSVIEKPLDDLVAFMNGDTQKEAEEKQRKQLEQEQLEIQQKANVQQNADKNQQQQQQQEPEQFGNQQIPSQQNKQSKVNDQLPTQKNQNIKPKVSNPGDADFDPSQLRGKNFFQATEEEERKFQALINNKMKNQQQTEGELQQLRAVVAASRPAEFKHDLTDQEYAQLVTENSKFPMKEFEYQEYSKLLQECWEKDDNKPAELTSQQRTNDDVSKLMMESVNEMIIRLICSKNLEHVREGIRFFDAAIKADYKCVVQVMYALKIVSQQSNLAMLYICQWLYSRVYLALIDKYTDKRYTDVFTIKLVFPNVSDQISKQKENAILLGKMQIAFKNKQDTSTDVDDYLIKLIKEKNSILDFYNDVLFLTKPLVDRIHSPLRPAKVVALNVLTTVSSFPLFSAKNFFIQLLSKQSVDKFTKNFNDNAIEKDTKYQSVLEQRALACKAFIQNSNYLITEQSIKQLTDYISWCLPWSNKTEWKKAVLYLVQEIYKQDEFNGVSIVVAILNKKIKNATLMKQITQDLIQIDKDAKQPPQIAFVEGSKTDKNDNARIVIINEKINTNMQQNIDLDFPPGQCQFCCKEVTKVLKEVEKQMHQHLMLDCPCCCICPACKQVIELCYISQHLCNGKECSGLRDYQYNLVNCSKCILGFEQQLLKEHQQQCHCNLQSEQMICPLCNQQMENGEEALIHYSENKCQANPRTSKEFQEIIQQKLDAK